jgi:uncharacterized protein YmfQ (DUF2313 family)
MFRDAPAAAPLQPAVPSGLPPEAVALCGLTVEEWTRTLLDLLPRGVVWPREPGTVLEAFWTAIADAMVAIQRRDCALLDEAYPCGGGSELLPEWEDELGLPDVCTSGQEWTVAARQQFVCAKLAAQGGASPAYFIELAALYGYTITIQEHWPWRMGCSDGLCDITVGVPVGWWTVISPSRPVQHLTVGCWRMGEPLCVIPGQDLLECILRRAAPANTTLTFAYTLAQAVWNKGRWSIDRWS